ncbi:hypothetical protein WJX84_000589 [Apatococcus fuscideae]|uniref:Protein arginine N-methyltransferase domain-containing protein n=1 Tax=Apatococcus fuscideae TaxID=2026836 RepID=A0AAW1TML4_9CHLO
MEQNGRLPENSSDLKGDAPDATDFANYFCTYAFLFHQKEMLEDHKRTGAYYTAIMQNQAQFKDKVVLDVGAGSGILAIFAAQAGARKVYAVEATDVAKHARKLVQHNRLGSIISVIQGTIETVELPEKVDLIVSEWMGYFLLRESMLDSVLVARDKFLKPGGALYPSHARLYVAPIRSNLTHSRQNEFRNAMEGWASFTDDMQRYYGVRMDCLNDSFRDEQKQYYQQTAAWADVSPNQLAGRPWCFKQYDLLTVTPQEIIDSFKEHFELQIIEAAPIEAFAGFFDVQFKGSPENPASFEVLLSTAPDPQCSTHWGQQVFHLYPPINAQPGDRISGDINISRKKENHRLMQVVFQHCIIPRQQQPQAATPKLQSTERVDFFSIE